MHKILKEIKFKLGRWKRIPSATYLCIKYPFLYPRNRFTGLHYNNWKIIEHLKTLNKEAFKYGNREDSFMRTIVDRKKYFKYMLLKWFHDKFLQHVFCLTSYTELDAMDKGWKKAFGLQMCKEIKQALLDAGGKKLLRSYRIMQIKEKYGQLCWYDGGAPKEVQKIIAKYEYISARTCIDCGKTADGMTRGYILPYCEKCAHDQELDRYYTKEMPFYGHYYA